MRSWNYRIAFGIFLFLLSVYLASYSGHIHSIDEAYVVAVTANLGKGRLDVNQVAFYQTGFERIAQIGTIGPSGDVFCKKGLAASLLAVPFFWASKFVPGVGAVHAAHLTNGVVTAATGGLLFLYLMAIGFSARASLLSALTWGLGTIAWPYARLFFTEPVAALGFLTSFYGCALFRQRHAFGAAFLSGLGFGLAVAAAPFSVLAFPFIVAGLFPSSPVERSKKRLTATGWLIGMAGPVLMTAFYNLCRFGNPLDSGYRLTVSDFDSPFAGILGLLVSPGRGLVFYSSAILLAIPGYFLSHSEHRAEVSRISALWLTYLLFFGGWKVWHGGWSWGPRYLVPLLPLMFPLVASVWESFPQLHPLWRGLILLVVGLSVLVQVIGVAGDYVSTEFILEQEIGNQPDPWYYRGQLGLFHPLYSPLVVQARNLRPDTLDLGWIAGGHPDKAGLAAVILCLLVGGLGLWFALMPRSTVRPLILCGTGLLLCTWVLVARSTERSLEPFRGDGRLEALSLISAHRTPGDGLVSDTGYLYEFILEQYHDLPPTYIPPASDPDMATSLLNLAIARHPRIWFIGGYVMPGDLGRWMERWLSQNAFPLQSWDFAYHHVSLFSTPGEVLVSGEPGVVLGDAVRLRAFRLTYRREGMDEIFQLAISWEALGPLQRDYQVFVHAYDPAMNLLAQADHPPVNGFHPTSSWRPGEIVEDRVAFRVPLQALETGFSLAVGLYDLHSPADRLPVRTPAGTFSDDRVWLVLP